MVKSIVAAIIAGIFAFGVAACQKEEAAVKDAETKVEQAINKDTQQPAEANKPEENKAEESKSEENKSEAAQPNAGEQNAQPAAPEQKPAQ